MKEDNKKDIDGEMDEKDLKRMQEKAGKKIRNKGNGQIFWGSLCLAGNLMADSCLIYYELFLSKIQRSHIGFSSYSMFFLASNIILIVLYWINGMLSKCSAFPPSQYKAKFLFYVFVFSLILVFCFFTAFFAWSCYIYVQAIFILVDCFESNPLSGEWRFFFVEFFVTCTFYITYSIFIPLFYLISQFKRYRKLFLLFTDPNRFHTKRYDYQIQDSSQTLGGNSSRQHQYVPIQQPGPQYPAPAPQQIQPPVPQEIQSNLQINKED